MSYELRLMDNLHKQFGDRIKTDFNVSPYFTLKMKTQADFYIEAESVEDWQNIAYITSAHSIPLFVLGGGSNIAVTKEVISGLVVRNHYIQKNILKETSESIEMFISSGYPMSRVVKETVEEGLSGFQYHLGLPGTLGGAVAMNSKWTRPESYVSDTLIRANIMTTNGEIREVEKSYFEFAYDYSRLKDTGEIFLDGVFLLTRVDSEELKTQSRQALNYRKETQPFGVATGGCFFQNISESVKIEQNLPTTSAGYLIDHAGLKGTKVGAFVVSDKHANFVINTGGGTPADLAVMLNLIKSTVLEKYEVKLEEEVRVI